MPAPPPSPPAPDLLLRAARRVLRPLVRLLIGAGVTFPVLADLLRRLYVEVAAETLGGPAATDSRLSLATGVHRKEIRRLRTAEPEAAGVPAVVSLNSQLIARWVGAAPFLDRRRRPLALPRVPPVAGGPSFELLVSSVTTDIRPRAVLDAWLAQGIVTLDRRDRVRLATAAFVPPGGSAEQIFFLGRNLADHAAAAAANVAASTVPGTAAPYLDRSVHYDGLSAADAERLVAAGRASAEAALLDINRLALATVDPEPVLATPAEPARRVNIGIYVYADDERPADAR